MNLSTKHLAALHVTCRVLCALIGGYLLSTLSAILIALHLPGDKVNSIITGLLLTFIIYTVAVIYVFAAKTTLRASMGVFVPCVLMYCFYYFNGISV